MNDEFVRASKDEVLSYNEQFFQHSLADTEENHGNPRSR